MTGCMECQVTRQRRFDVLFYRRFASTRPIGLRRIMTSFSEQGLKARNFSIPTNSSVNMSVEECPHKITSYVKRSGERLHLPTAMQMPLINCTGRWVWGRQKVLLVS